MKPLYSGHDRDHKIVSIIESVRFIEFLPKLAYFTSKTYSPVLGYSAIEPKVRQKVGVGRRKNLKTILENITRISRLYDNLRATG